VDPEDGARGRRREPVGCPSWGAGDRALVGGLGAKPQKLRY